MMLDPIPEPPLTSLPNILIPKRRALPSWLYGRPVLLAYVALALGSLGLAIYLANVDSKWATPVWATAGFFSVSVVIMLWSIRKPSVPDNPRIPTPD
jgi:hypothetical protein